MDSTLYRTIRTIVREQLGLSLASLEETRVRGAIETMLDGGPFDSHRELARHLEVSSDSELIDELIGHLVSGETYFFRDQHPFVGLRDTILVELLNRSRGRTCTIWSAACATGQETYSLAILIAEHFSDYWPEGVHLLGSDVSAEAIAHAERGEYSQLEVNRGLPARYLSTYFEQTQRRWRVVPELRAGVEFRQINLLGDLPRIRPPDVVMLRYLLSYYDEDKKKAILDAIHRAMAPRGYLVLGGAETWGDLHEGFRLERSEQTRYYRRIDT